MQQKELVEYTVIDLVTQDFTADAEKYHEAVELRGEVELTVLAQTFFFWRSKTQEIVYRQNENTKAFVVFSRLDEGKFFRPDDILGPIRFSEEELDQFEEDRKQDTRDLLELNLDVLTEKFRKDNGLDIKGFLAEIYATNPKKEKVTLVGETLHPFLYLLLLDWLATESQEIFFNTQKLI